MKIKCIENQKTWTQFQETYGSGGLFQSWLWGEVLRRQGIKVLRFGLFDGNEVVAIAQTHFVKAKRGSFIQVRHGPILKRWDQKIFTYFTKLITAQFAVERPLFLRVNPLITKAFEIDLQKSHFRSSAIHAMDAELCWVLRLDSDEHMLSGMRKSTRYDIKRAEKLGITIRKTTDLGALGDFFRLYKATASRHGFVEHHGITEEFEIFSKEGKAQLYFAEHNGVTLAATIILYCGNQAIYHHSASDKTTLPLTHLLQWQAICDARDKGLTYYNFWGIAPEGAKDHPFKTGFGGERSEFIHAHDLPLSPLYIVPHAVEKIRAWKKGY